MNLAGRARDPTKARVGGWKFANSNFQDAKQSRCNFFTQDRILQQQDCMLSIPYPIHPLEVSWIHSWDTYGYMISIHPFFGQYQLIHHFPLRIWEAPTQSPSQHCSSSRCQSAHSRIRDRLRIHLDDDRIDGYHRGHLRNSNDFQIAVCIFLGGVGGRMVYPSSELFVAYIASMATSFLPPTNRSHLPHRLHLPCPKQPTWLQPRHLDKEAR